MTNLIDQLKKLSYAELSEVLAELGNDLCDNAICDEDEEAGIYLIDDVAPNLSLASKSEGVTYNDFKDHSIWNKAQLGVK